MISYDITCFSWRPHLSRIFKDFIICGTVDVGRVPAPRLNPRRRQASVALQFLIFRGFSDKGNQILDFCLYWNCPAYFLKYIPSNLGPIIWTTGQKDLRRWSPWCRSLRCSLAAEVTRLGARGFKWPQQGTPNRDFNTIFVYFYWFSTIFL